MPTFWEWEGEPVSLGLPEAPGLVIWRRGGPEPLSPSRPLAPPSAVVIGKDEFDRMVAALKTSA